MLEVAAGLCFAPLWLIHTCHCQPICIREVARLAGSAGLRGGPTATPLGGRVNRYRATLDRIADETGLTVQEAREAIALYDARMCPCPPLDESLDAIGSRFVGTETNGRLAQAVPSTVLANRQGAQPSARKTS